MRLDNLLSNLSYGSRKEVKELIKKGHVKVNNKIIYEAQLNVDPSKDIIAFNDEVIFYREELILMINKPHGYICSNIDEGYPSLLNILPDKLKKFTWHFCGRLDVDVEGLVIISTNGKLVHNIISPNKDIKKKYLVKTKNEINEIESFKKGIIIKDGKNEVFQTKEADILLIDSHSCILTISEGKYHQVKRMFLALGNEVIYLKRIQIGNLLLPDQLETGHYMEISENMIF